MRSRSRNREIARNLRRQGCGWKLIVKATGESRITVQRWCTGIPKKETSRIDHLCLRMIAGIVAIPLELGIDDQKVGKIIRQKLRRESDFVLWDAEVVEDP